MHRLCLYFCWLVVSYSAFSAPIQLQISASESLDGVKYPASNAVDGNPKTAYCTRAASPWLEIVVPADKRVESLVFVPGYQKSKAIYEANSRPRSVHVLVSDEVGDGTASTEAKLQEGFGVKSPLAVPYLEHIKASKIRFDLGSPTSSKFPEVCVSEIEVKLSPRTPGASAADRAFIVAHKDELTLEGLEKHSQTVMRLAELASRANDLKVAGAILKLSQAGLDGVYSMQYSHLLFQFVKGDPAFAVGEMQSFFKGKWETPLQYLCNETGEIDADVLKGLLAKVPSTSKHSKAAKELIRQIDQRMERMAKEAGNR